MGSPKAGPTRQKIKGLRRANHSLDERFLVKKDISGIVLAINVSKVDDARGLGFSAHVVVERKVRALLKLKVI